MNWKFEDYQIETGKAVLGLSYAAIREFAALAVLGETPEAAITNLRDKFEQRLKHLLEAGEPIPAPGDPPGVISFAPSDKIEALRPFVDEFWTVVLGTSYRTSFVSNKSQLSSWEHYVGGRDQLVKRVLDVYGVDVTEDYDKPIYEVLSRILEHRTQR